LHSGDEKTFKVLIVEDDPQHAAATRRLLEKESFDVTVSRDGEGGLEQARSLPADLIVLDVRLPGIDGIETCRRLRTFSDAYVIMLTGLDSETDRVVGLSVGADDYVSKPYYPRELLARIRAVKRRPREPHDGDALYQHGELRIDAGAREVTVEDRRVPLSRTEFDLLATLAAQPRVALSRQQLLEAVWGEGWFSDDHVIDVHMSNLRKKLGAPGFIETVRGYGYKMGTG
jgi:DNA-binding response OmpR family regulator